MHQLSFPGVFSGSDGELNYNGDAVIDPGGAKANLCSGSESIGSVWTKEQFDVRKFHCSFTFRLSAGWSNGGGMVFSIQRAGNQALGEGGAYMGYQSIGTSVALKFGVYPGVSNTGLYRNGQAPGNEPPGSIDMQASGIQLHSGHVFSVELDYDWARRILHERVSDLDSGIDVFVHDYGIDIPAVIGGEAGYIGFCGATGGASALYEILSWTYNSETLPYSVAFEESPEERQLFPRNLTSNSASVSISGTESVGGFVEAVLRVYRNGVLVGSEDAQSLVYQSGVAHFGLTRVIAAESAEYRFVIALRDTNLNETIVRDVEDVVAGDVFVIQGQSNATTVPYEGDAGSYSNPYLRTFGVITDDVVSSINGYQWFIATGDGAQFDGTTIWNPAGSVGQWGLVLGSKLVTDLGVPIAIVNGGHGGSPIAYFQRNDAVPNDLSTNYGRLSDRLQQAGLSNSVRALFYFQGEADLGNANAHENGFIALHSDWLSDYPTIQKIYVFQVREGCGVTRFDVDLRNRQRLFPDLFGDVEVISTNGMDEHDGCHFAFLGGYESLGVNVERMILRDLYNVPVGPNANPPNPAIGAVFPVGQNDKIRIPLREKTDSISFQPGAEQDFVMDGTNVSVIGGTVVGGALELQLSGNGTGAMAVRYSGHSGDGAINTLGKWVRNANGIGLLSFDLPIVEDSSAPSVQLVGPSTIYLAIGSAYSDPGVHASDEVDGDLSSLVVASGAPVNTDSPGVFTVSYQATDSAGNVSPPVSRNVIVVDVVAPNVRVSSVWNAGTGNHDAHVSFASTVGLQYTVMTTPDLVDWTDLSSVNGTGSVLEVIHEGGANTTPRFYKVRVIVVAP